MNRRMVPLSSGKIQLLKRGLRTGMNLETCAKLLYVTEDHLRDQIAADERLREMVETIPLQGALELQEAMHTNAVENMDGSVQKFLAKNRLGMKDKVEVEQKEVRISVTFEEGAKALEKDRERVIEGEIEDAVLEEIDEEADGFEQAIEFLSKVDETA